MSRFRRDDPDSKADDKRLDRLLQYTLFHLGAYITLGTGIVGVLAWDAKSNASNPDGLIFDGASGMLMVLALACLAIAGTCGGTVAAKISQSTSMERFLSRKVSLLGYADKEGGWSPTALMSLEHWSFWIGLSCGGAAGLLATWRLNSG